MLALMFTAANQTALTVFQQRLPTAATQYHIWMTRYSFCIGRPTPAWRGGSLHNSARLSCFTFVDVSTCFMLLNRCSWCLHHRSTVYAAASIHHILTEICETCVRRDNFARPTFINDEHDTDHKKFVLFSRPWLPRFSLCYGLCASYFLANVNSRSHSLYAVARPSVCRLSVVCRR